MSKITSRDESFFFDALSLAAQSKCCYRHGAIIMRAGNILAKGYNKYTYVKNVTRRYGHPCITIHAEIAALKKCWGMDIKNTVLYSARIMHGTINPLISKPCPTCTVILQEWGIHTVVYFDGNKLIKERM